MAAVVTHVSGSDFLMKAGGTTIGGGPNGTQSINREEIVYSPPTPNYDKNSLPGVISSSGGGDFDYLKSSVGVKGCDMSISYDGDDILKLKTFTLQSAMSIKDRTSADDACIRDIGPGKRNATLSVVCDYTDPAVAAAAAELQIYTDIQAATPTAVTIIITFGAGQTITFTGLPLSWEMTNINDQRAETDVGLNMSFTVIGAIVLSDTGLDAGLAAIVDAHFAGAATASTPVVILMSDGQAGHTEYTSTVYITQFTYTGDSSGLVTCSMQFEVDGAIAESTVGA